MDIVIVIMAGGLGTRFWPLSTDETPKQFLRLFGDRSMLQECYERIRGVVKPERVLVLTNCDYVAMVREQLPAVPADNIIGEPMRRDTAAAIALSALICRKRFGNPVIVTLTADHFIEPVELFLKTLQSAVHAASDNDVLYTFGIRPAFPATGYGYLERGSHIMTDNGIEHYGLLSFKEKPDIETARMYVESGRYYWNSGMFVWRTDAIIKRLEQFLPGHITSIDPAVGRDGASVDSPALAEAFKRLPSTSIDFGVMERATNVCCVESTFSWNDRGGWLSLREFLPADGSCNFHRGDIIASDSQNNLVFCENPGETVMMIGVHDLVIVRAGSNTLIVHKDRAEEVKELVKKHIGSDRNV